MEPEPQDRVVSATRVIAASAERIFELNPINATLTT